MNGSCRTQSCQPIATMVSLRITLENLECLVCIDRVLNAITEPKIVYEDLYQRSTLLHLLDQCWRGS